MNGHDYSPQQEASYQALCELHEELDDADMERPRSVPGVLLQRHPFSDAAEFADESRERLEYAVGQARQVGLAWDRIGEALGMTGREAEDEFGPLES